MEKFPGVEKESKSNIELSIEMAQQVLHSLGLYDASNDFYPTTEYDDETWVIPHTV